MTETSVKTSKIYFDGQCPVCTAEMCKLSDMADNGISVLDIHQLSNDFDGPSQEDLLKVLHLQTSAGKWLKGLDANVAAWQHTRWGWLAKPLRWPLIRNIADFIYYRWAENRYRKKYGE